MAALPKAVIFDYYETIVDISNLIREQVFDTLARDLGVDLPPGEAYQHWRELTTKDWKIRLGGLERPPLNGPAPEFITFREVWSQRSAELFRHWGVDAPGARGADAYREAHASALVFPDVRPAVDALRAHHRVAVLSDADHDFIDASMSRNGLSFDAVVTSEEMRVYKPHVSLFREACARLDVEAHEALYVGDSPWADIEGARHAGLRAVWINRRDQRWPRGIEPPAETVTSLAELAGVFAEERS